MRIHPTRFVAALALGASLALCPAAAFADSVYTAPAQTSEVSIKMPETDGDSQNFNAYKAKLVYSKSVFEPVTAKDFECKAPWQNIAFNPDTGEFAAASTEAAAPGSVIAVVKMTAKEGVQPGQTYVSMEDVQASAGTDDVYHPSNGVTVNIRDKDDTTGSQGAGSGSGSGAGAGAQNTIVSGTAPVANNTTVGAAANGAKGALAQTGDDSPLPFVILVIVAVMAACVVVSAAMKPFRRRPEDMASMGRLFLAVALAFGISGVAGLERAQADTPDFDLNHDGKVDSKDIEYLLEVLVGLRALDMSTDVNNSGTCSVTDLSIAAKYIYALPPSGEDAKPGNTNNPGSSSSSSSDSASEPSQPETPGTTNSPDTPGSGDSPSAPSTPDTPGGNTPDAPSTPDTPDPAITVESTRFQGYDFKQIEPHDIPVTYTEIQMRTAAMKEKGYYGDHSQWPTGLEISSDGALALVGTDCCGLYRSTDRGQTWEQAQTGFHALSTCSFAIDPHNSSHALAMSGARKDAGLTWSGIYQTTDAAQSWSQTNKVVPKAGQVPEGASASPYHIMVKGWRYDWDGFEFDPATYDAELGITTDVYLSLPYVRDRDIRGDTAELAVKTPEERFMPLWQAGLYRSRDGGSTFELVKQDLRLCDGILKFTDDGRMYIANQYGLMEVDKETGDIKKTLFENTGVGTALSADDLGEKIQYEYKKGTLKWIYKIYMGVTGFDVVGNTLYVQTWDGIFKSGEGTPQSDDDFQKINGDTYDRSWPQYLTVSKQNPSHMMMMAKASPWSYYNNYLYYSHDGGYSWTMSDWDKSTIFTEPDQWNSIERLIIYDPTDETGNTVIANGNGVITRSTDGGAMFVQTNGISNIMAGAKFNLNYYNPDVITFGCQDFAGAISQDNGDTWTQLHARKLYDDDPTRYDQTRSLYASFSPDGETVVGWGINKYNGIPTLMVSYDGGFTSKTWWDTELLTEVTGNRHAYSTLQSYNDPDVIMSNEWRSDDRGRTWRKMDDCLTAYTVNYTGQHEIYGANKQGRPVVSYDEGKTWQVLFEGEKLCTFWALVPGTEKIDDLAYDHVNNVLYCLVRFSTKYSEDGKVNDGATRVVRLPLDDPDARKTLDISIPVGYRNIRGIAVDPNSTSVLYVASVANNVVNPTGLYRSIDGGETFTNLTWSTMTYTADGAQHTVTNKALNQGGYEPAFVRVDPRNGRCFIGTGCYGYEWINPPYDEALVSHEVPRDHVVKYVVDGKVVHEDVVKNGYWWKDEYRPERVGYVFDGWYRDSACSEKANANTAMLDSVVMYGRFVAR